MEIKRKISVDEDIYSGSVWSASQRRVLNVVLNKDQSVFITGAGGVGKSKCIDQIVKIMKERGLKVAVTAHTGIAAITIKGQTLWSFMHFNKERLKQSKEIIASEFLKKKYWCSVFQSYRALIIDEISMIDPHHFEIMDHVLQITRRDYRPFGGLQLILVGDFFQLPSPEDIKFSLQKYVFHNDSFWASIDEMHDLQEMWRQKDPAFVSLLHRARRGQQTDEDIKLLHTRIGIKLKCEDDGISPTRLYSHNKDVDEINEKELLKLDTEICYFKFRYGNYNSRKFSSKTIDSSEINTIKLLQDLGAVKYVQDAKLKDLIVKEVPLKIGSQVMLSYNLDVSSGLVNGARGVIIRWGKTNEMRTRDKEELKVVDEESSFGLKFEDPFLYPDECLPVVKFACGRTIEVPYVRYTLEKDGMESYAWRIAIKLAWATSIHKSQSLTLDAAEIDLSQCFEAGMAYVALSRITSLENLRIAKEFKSSTFKIDPDVIKFYDTPFLVQKSLRTIENLPITSSNTNITNDYEIE